MKGLVRTVALGLSLVLSGAAPLVASTQDPPPQKPPVRVGSGVKQPKQLKNVDPEYPAIAKAAKVQGTVILEIVVNKEGSVTSAKALKPVPLLDEAALAAVKKWKYETSYLDGEAVDVIMVVSVVFSLR